MGNMIDWQKDAHGSLWCLSAYERETRGRKLTEDERAHYADVLKENVARYCRMATQKNAGQRGGTDDLDVLNGLWRTEMMIVIAATELCLDGVFGSMPEKIEGDEYVWRVQNERGNADAAASIRR